MKRICIGAVCIVYLLCGCATKKIIDESMRTEMYVMVYDYENNGLQNVLVYINDELIGKTDVNGRYLLDLAEGQYYKIKIQKNEYESAGQEFIYDPLFVLYFQIGNAPQLLSLAEAAMDEACYEDAVMLLERSIKLDSNRADALYLKAIACYKLGRNEEAEIIINELTSLVHNAEALDGLKQRLNPPSRI